ncbi:MAG TPA: hypothetical protein VG294_11080 [Solirubrobacteraceae bacterium]|nr:hypothetical protein [Solirubrobacteraceae bacterium]
MTDRRLARPVLHPWPHGHLGAAPTASQFADNRALGSGVAPSICWSVSAANMDARSLPISSPSKRASIVPDGIATLVLHYQGRSAITAPVHDNVYWVSVPDYVPFAQGPPLSQAAAIRRAILHSLPTSIQWLAPDGHALRTFTPPPAYVHYLIAVYDSCQRANCGA